MVGAADIGDEDMFTAPENKSQGGGIPFCAATTVGAAISDVDETKGGAFSRMCMLMGPKDTSMPTLSIAITEPRRKPLVERPCSRRILPEISSDPASKPTLLGACNVLERDMYPRMCRVARLRPRSSEVAAFREFVPIGIFSG